jgi:hypothetical protein
MKARDKVKFVEPMVDEQNLTFEVLEDRGDRVLVTALDLFDDWAIKPTSVYLKDELELISEPGKDRANKQSFNLGNVTETVVKKKCP